jgi:predicted SPOUT superfamily RNA methylase MTH1
VTRLLKARTVEPEETPVVREWLVNTFPRQGIQNSTTEELLEAVFSMLSMQRLYKESQLEL